MMPALSVTRKFPSGSSATDQGPVSRFVTLSTFIGADGFAGFGAPVWPEKAGVGLRGASPAKRPCAKHDAAIKSVAVNLMQIQ
jgi:hypothetical protein